MNVFNDRSFDRVGKFVNRIEKDRRDPLHPQSLNQAFSNWNWYIVVDAGPASEKDYTDERYWLKRAELTNAVADDTVKLTGAALADTDDRFLHITATNMAEWPFGTHTVEVGTLVNVHVSYGPSSIETPRYWFVHGQGTELLYYLGGFFNAAGTIHAPSIAIAQANSWYRFNYEDYPWFASQSLVKQSVVWNGDLYAIGDFKVAISPTVTPPTSSSEFTSTATKFAKWDDTNEEWVDVGGAATNLLLNTVNCLIEYGGNLLIGGGGNTTFVTGVRQWNGTSFSNVGSLGNDFGEVFALKEYAGDLYAGGDINGTENGDCGSIGWRVGAGRGRHERNGLCP